MSDFVLDPRLEGDTLPVADLALSTLRLSKDARFPWLILVPNAPDVAEIIDLDAMDRASPVREIVLVFGGATLRPPCHKLNVAALGNQVRQLHVHVIAQFEADAAWPRPVWGVGEAVAYEPAARDRLLLHSANTSTHVVIRTMASFFEGLPETEASSLHGFSGNQIDRRSEKRDNGAAAAALADPQARLYLFQGDRAVLRTNGADPTFTSVDAVALGAKPRDAIILLGWTEAGARLDGHHPGHGRYSTKAHYRVIDLRSLAVEGSISAADLGAMAQARSLCHWHLRHGFCAVCGSPTAMKIGGYRRDCPACGAQHFPRTRPGGDHARGRRRPRPARAAGASTHRACIPASPALRRPGETMTSRPPRDAGGGGDPGRPGPLPFEPAVAVPVVTA